MAKDDKPRFNELQQRICINPHLLTTVWSRIADNYSYHIKAYTDGSVLENDYVGAAFLIPHFKTETEAFHIGKNYTIIFRSGSVCCFDGIIALFDLPCTSLSILFYVDFKSTLLALNNLDNKFRSDVASLKLSTLIHSILTKGTFADFY